MIIIAKGEDSNIYLLVAFVTSLAPVKGEKLL